MNYQIHKYEMQGANFDISVMFSIIIVNVFTCFIFVVISYVMFYSQSNLFIKNYLSVRQTAQM